MSVLTYINKKTLIIILLMMWLNPLSAAETVKEVVDNIKIKVVNIQTNVANLPGKIDSKLGDLPTTIQTKLGVNLNTDTKDKILSVFTDITAALAVERDNIQAFGDGSSGTGCYDFKTNLVEMFVGINDISISLATFGGVAMYSQPSISNSEMNDALNIIPCPALMPLSIPFRVVSLPTVSNQVTNMSNNIDLAKDFFDENNPLTCELIAERGQIYQTAARGIFVTSVGLKGLAALIDPDKITGPINLLKTPIEVGDKEVGIHGYGSLTLKHPAKKKKLAAGIKVMAETANSIATYVFMKTRHCELTVNQESILAKYDTMLENQNAILVSQADMLEKQTVLIEQLCESARPRIRSDICQN